MAEALLKYADGISTRDVESDLYVLTCFPGHGKGVKTPKQGRCTFHGGKQTLWACECGVRICSPAQVGHNCWMKHICAECCNLCMEDD
eukprot:353360-Chlamydomonas_euryale.AAC.1